MIIIIIIITIMADYNKCNLHTNNFEYICILRLDYTEHFQPALKVDCYSYM